VKHQPLIVSKHATKRQGWNNDKWNHKEERECNMSYIIEMKTKEQSIFELKLGQGKGRISIKIRVAGGAALILALENLAGGIG